MSTDPLAATNCAACSHPEYRHDSVVSHLGVRRKCRGCDCPGYEAPLAPVPAAERDPYEMGRARGEATKAWERGWCEEDRDAKARTYTAAMHERDAARSESASDRRERTEPMTTPQQKTAALQSIVDAVQVLMNDDAPALPHTETRFRAEKAEGERDEAYAARANDRVNSDAALDECRALRGLLTKERERCGALTIEVGGLTAERDALQRALDNAYETAAGVADEEAESWTPAADEYAVARSIATQIRALPAAALGERATEADA